jgi:hypothetical protein
MTSIMLVSPFVEHRARLTGQQMNQYRDFDNNANTFDYATGQAFLKRLHDGGRHYIPIVDSVST